MTINLFTADKILHSFGLPYALKLTASQTKIFVLFSNKKDKIICVNNASPATNLSDMDFIHLLTCEIQIYFCSCMTSSKRKFKLPCPKYLSSLKYVKVPTASHSFICFYGFIL